MPESSSSKPGPKTRVLLYTRVSTSRQTAANQIQVLTDVGKRLGWNIVGVITDTAVSGSKGREQRPGFNELMTAITRGECDLVAAWDASRLSRSIKHLVEFLEHLKHRNCGLYLHQSGIDTTTPSGQALIHMLGVFSQLERSLTIERIHAGLARARREGKRLGRPRIDADRLIDIKKMIRSGNGIQKTARTVGCGVSVVQRVKKELALAESI